MTRDTIRSARIARPTPAAVVAILCYAAAILLANVLTSRLGLVEVGFGLLVTAGTFAAGLALLARDFVQNLAGLAWVLAGIVLGIALSFVFAAPAIAVASAVAFAVAELVDLVVFTTVRRRGFVRAAAISNLVAAPLDTVLFLWIAGFPLTWQAITGQLIGKLFWATLIPLAVYVGISRAVLRTRHDDARS